MYFYGSQDYLLDERNRMPIPPDFRDDFEGGAFLVLGSEPCIEMYTRDGWQAQAEILRSLVVSSETARDARRAFAANTHRATRDSQGRVVIPEDLIAELGLPKRVKVIGRFECLEIWGRDTYEGMKDRLRTTHRDVLNRLAESQQPELYGKREG